MLIHDGSNLTRIDSLKVETEVRILVQVTYPVTVLRKKNCEEVRKATDVHIFVSVSHWMRVICQVCEEAGATSQALWAKIPPEAKGKSQLVFTAVWDWTHQLKC